MKALILYCFLSVINITNQNIHRRYTCFIFNTTFWTPFYITRFLIGLYKTFLVGHFPH